MKGMRTVTTGWLLTLGIAACSCGQPPPSTDSRVNPQPPAARPTPEAEPEPDRLQPDPGPAPLPRGPVAVPSSEVAHAVAQRKFTRSEQRLPALEPVPEPSAEPVAPALADQGAPSTKGTPTIPARKGAAVKRDDEGLPNNTQDADAPTPAQPDEVAGLPGYFVPVTEPTAGPALAHFHRALQALAAGNDPDGKVRVAMYGASGTAADLSVGYVRTYLQSRFGDGGPGFVPLVPLGRWYRHSELSVDASKGWTKEHAQIYSGRQDGHYGLLGASFTATRAKRWATVGPKKGSTSSDSIAHVELMFLRQPGGGAFSVRVDGGPPVVVETAADDFAPGYHGIEVEPGPHTVRVETASATEVRVFGVVLERAEPGVVVDVLGINGTRGRNHLTWNETLWADNIRRRAPDLYTLSYGTNESVDDDLSVLLYAEDLRAQLRRFRAVLPEASCLVIGPCDFPIRDKKTNALSSRPLLNSIIEVQREVAAQEGCGFWDGVAFMGGELAMATWVEHDPPLARDDYLHFNLRGASRKGMALADALMHAFDARGMAGGEGSSINVSP